jgi:tetratricopeptide (TPR) repeat protein
MDWTNDPGKRRIEEQRDEELRKAHQAIKLEAEIAALKARNEPAVDRARIRFLRKLNGARGLLQLALDRGGVGFSDAFDAANEVLQLDPDNSEALAIRAIAHAGRKSFREAVQDADAAIALNPNDRSPFGVRMREELPTWRRSVRWLQL